MNYRMQICQSIGEITQAEWNSLLLSSNNGILHPALRHEYLHALETEGCATAETGWAPIHLGIRNETDALIAAMPLYIKSHSYGEYVFDWAWAQAYERNGLNYYPKLLSAIPFTPVLGPKLLGTHDEAKQVLVNGLMQLTAQCSQDESILGTRVSSLHTLFLTEIDQTLLLAPQQELELDSRLCVQFHWKNEDAVQNTPYRSFDDYLDSLNQKKRKNIRAERRKAREDNVEITRLVGNEITQDHLEFFYRCYSQTYIEHFSTPYLSLSFFENLLQTMGEQIMIAQAHQNDQPIASSFFLFNENRLYGRYWGATQKVACMHFELCYYQGIEFAIENNIQWFEGGAQGEHKMARGLNPVTMTSAHWVAESGFKQPIRLFLEREREHLGIYTSELGEHTAFKKASDGLIEV